VYMCYFVDLKFMDNLILIIPMSNMIVIILFYFIFYIETIGVITSHMIVSIITLLDILNFYLSI
jgi:hypothetical protein